MKQGIAGLLLILILILALCSCGQFNLLSSQNTTCLTLVTSAATFLTTSSHTGALVTDGYYSTPDDVAAYLHIYQQLPQNYITKLEATNLAWDSSTTHRPASEKVQSANKCKGLFTSTMNNIEGLAMAVNLNNSMV